MNRVVISGLGVISPVGCDINSYWNNLCAGYCGIGQITKFDASEYKAKLAAEVRDFNPSLYFSDKNEIRRLDLFAQYAIGAASQAVEDSGICGNIDSDRFGVYVGSGIGGINTFVSETEKLFNRGPSKVSPFFIPMMIGNMAAGLIAIRYNAQGPCLPVVTACATSTHTIGEAFRAIKYGHADAIIAGGTEATINPLAIAGFINCMALSCSSDPLCASIPFDRRRDGFIMGEGAAVLILEEYNHAIKRGAKIYAEICGYGNTCDAYHITAPAAEPVCGARAVKLAAEEGGILDNGLMYINAHGTSTPLNDKCETQAIKMAFGNERAYNSYVSSTKSMTGHMLGAAGAIESAACVLALRDGIVPPTIGYIEPDPECDLNYVPNKSVRADIDCAVSISLGFGGHNACVAFKKI